MNEFFNMPINKNSEIEYKITNRLEYTRFIQTRLILLSSELSTIQYYKSNVPNVVYRTTTIDGKAKSEIKKHVIKNQTVLNCYPYKLQYKYSEENETEIKFDVLTTQCKRMRLTYRSTKPNLPFKIDVSLRVFCNNPDDVVITESDVITPNIIMNKEFKLVYDIEFEQIDMSISIKDAFGLLCSWLCEISKEYEIYRITNEITELQDEITTEHDNGLNEEFKQNFKMIGGEKSEQLINIINKTFDFTLTPQVDIATNKLLQSISKDNFVWLDKTDGLRTLIVCFDGVINSFVKGELHSLDIVDKNAPVFVVDTEFKDDVYYVFDVYFYNSDVRLLTFEERLKTFDINKINTQLKFVIKPYHKIEDWTTLINYAMTVHPGIDGVILQSKAGYDVDLKNSFNWIKKKYQFKLKPLELTTTDFLYVAQKLNPKRYDLYLSGNYFDWKFNLSENVRKRMYIKTDNPKFVYLLFDTPLFNNAYYSEPTEQELNDLNVSNLDQMIIETAFINGRQIPIKIRNDKQFPNNYKVGLSNFCLLFSPPVSPDNNYFHTITPSEVEKNFDIDDGMKLINEFHVFNQNIRNYTFSKLKTLISKNATAIDLCGGRGADYPRLVLLKVNNILAVDADREALATYAMKAVNWKSVLPPTQTEPEYLNLNCVYGCVDIANDWIKELKARRNYRDADVIVIDYAIHYLNIEYVINAIKQIAKPGCVMLINFYDGDLIKAKQGKFKIFKINLYDNNTADMPLPTIEKKGYRNEPLVTNETVNRLKKEFKVIKEYYPTTEIEFLNACPEFKKSDLSDYLNCIKSLILKV